MKLKSVAAFVSVFGLTAGAANANMIYDFYAGANVAMGSRAMILGHSIDDHTAYSYGAMVGLDIPLLRGELEYNYLRSHADELQIAMANAYLKMPASFIQPYIGAGVGYLFAGDVAGYSIDKTIAYQGMLGVSLNPPVLPVSFDVEGRVLYAADVINADDQKPDVLQYEGRVKVRYAF